MKKLFALIVAFVTWSVAISQTTVSGNITGVWNLSGSPYVVIGNINVVDSLIIDPGVIVKFNAGGLSLTVGAGDKFLAKGNCNNPITFEAYTAQNPGAWNGLVFNGSGNDDSLFYCHIQSSTDGIFISGGSETYISNCIIHDNSNNGIQVKNSADPFIIDCIIYNNLYSGIHFYCLNCGFTTLGKVYNCISTQNCLSGISVRTACTSANAHPEISNCTLTRNGAEGLDVQQNVGTPDATIYNSIIAYNAGYGIRKQSGSSIGTNDVTYNCFWQNVSGQFSNLSGTGFGCAAQTGQYLNANNDTCDINFNICYEPFFVDMYCIRCNSGNQLQAGAKCINAATNIIFGQINSNVLDIGAFPSCCPICTSPCPTVCDSTVGINNYTEALSEYSILPNPTSSNFEINFNNKLNNGNIVIFNILGEIIYEENIFNESKKEIHLKNISNGIYFVKVFARDKYYCQKIIIEHD